MRISFRLILFFLLSSLALGQEGDCRDSLRELFRGDSVSQEKLREFLKLQSGITLHKLAYASVRSSGLEQEFRLEKEILNLLNKVRARRKSDPEFEKVYELFHDNGNKLSRNALAKALPYISDILNDQNKEQSAAERMAFNINQGDIKMLAILAEREAFANGQYASSLWRDASDDRSVLNFTKIINSSVRNSQGPSQGMLARFDERIEELHASAVELLNELDISDACRKEIASCVANGAGRSVVSPELSTFLTELVEEIELSDKHKLLRYDDVWLHTGKRAGADKIVKAAPPAKRKNAPKVYLEPERNPDKVIHQALIEKVLGSMPLLFTREDLAGDRELTLALAQAIDQGILGKKGAERFFYFKGQKYNLPELWNSETREAPDGKLQWAWTKALSLGDKAGDWWGVSRPKRFIQKLGLDVLELRGKGVGEAFPHIEKEDLPDFFATWEKQEKAFGHKFSFMFNGKLYNIDSGKEVEKGAKAFLTQFRAWGEKGSDVEIVSPFAQSPEVKTEIASEIDKENRAYINGGKALHISGVEVEFDREYDRAKKEQTQDSYPPKEAIKEIASRSPEMSALTLKTMADRKRSFVAESGKAYDLFRGEIDRTSALNIVKNADSRLPDTRLIANAVSILNDEAVFESEGKRFYADNGRALAAQAGNATLEGYVNDDRRQLELEKINAQEDISVILDYHKRYPNESCSAISVLDKSSAKLRVFEIKNETAYVVWESEALVGASVGDEKTEHRGGILGAVSNNKTAAGVFSFGRVSAEGPKRLELVSGGEVAAILGPAGTLRGGLLNDGNLENNRDTGGGILLARDSLARLEKDFMAEGCPFYVLPEGENVKFQALGQNLALVSGNRERSGNYHYTPSMQEEPLPIRILARNDSDLNQVSLEFLKSLEDNKARIMSDLGVSNSEYNQMAKLAFGILGVESQFGEGLELFPKGEQGGFELKKILNPRRHKEEAHGAAVVFLGKLLKRGEFSLDPDSRSRGLTQIKAVEDYPMIKKFGGINRDNLMEPDKAAVATMYVLGEMLERLKREELSHSSISDKNRMEYLYYIYNGQDKQIANSSATPELNEKARKVSAYADRLTVYSK